MIFQKKRFKRFSRSRTTLRYQPRKRLPPTVTHLLHKIKLYLVTKRTVALRPSILKDGKRRGLPGLACFPFFKSSSRNLETFCISQLRTTNKVDLGFSLSVQNGFLFFSPNVEQNGWIFLWHIKTVPRTMIAVQKYCFFDSISC